MHEQQQIQTSVAKWVSSDAIPDAQEFEQALCSTRFSSLRFQTWRSECQSGQDCHNKIATPETRGFSCQMMEAFFVPHFVAGPPPLISVNLDTKGFHHLTSKGLLGRDYFHARLTRYCGGGWNSSQDECCSGSLCWLNCQDISIWLLNSSLALLSWCHPHFRQERIVMELISV